MEKIIIFIALALLIVPLSVSAQSERVKLSSAEDIAIAFYRTANITPDFKKWIWQRRPYKLTPASQRPRVFEEEMARLQGTFQGFNKRRDRILVKFPVDINAVEKDGIYKAGMTLKGLDQAHYVSVSFLEEHIALFPYGMDGIMDSVIDASVYAQLKEMNQIKAKPYALIVMQADEANVDRPYEIDGLQQWVFKTRIEALSLYTEEGLIWEYSAPLNLRLNN